MPPTLRPIPQGWLTSSPQTHARSDLVRPPGGLALGDDPPLSGAAPADGTGLPAASPPVDPSRPALLTTAEAAALCRVCPRTLWNWRVQGLITPIRVTARTLLWRREDVLRLL